MTAFKPIGELSRAEQAWNWISEYPDDAEIPYRAMPFEQHIMYMLREKLAKRMEAEQQRTIVAARGSGWVIRRGIRQVDVADRHRRRARRAVERAWHAITNTDVTEMSGEERARRDDMVIRLAPLRQAHRSASRKLGLEEITKYGA